MSGKNGKPRKKKPNPEAEEPRRLAATPEVEARIRAVIGFLVAGLSTTQAYEIATTDNPDKNWTGWDISRRQFRDYVKAARAEIRRTAAAELPYYLGRALMRLDELYVKTMRIQDYKTALAVNKELHQLLGLHSPTKMRIEHDSGPPLAALLPAAVRQLASSPGAVDRLHAALDAAEEGQGNGNGGA